MPGDLAALTSAIKDTAYRLRFDMVGICPAVTPQGISRLREWLEAGYAGEMDYLKRHADAYEHPKHVLDGIRSIIMLGLNYRTEEPTKVPSGSGRVSRYAWGDDYHDVIRRRTRKLGDHIHEWIPGSRVRGVVDTAPLPEREFARLAGLGWIGKNTLLLNRTWGSWFFLAALLTDQVLEYDTPFEEDHCGTCTACLEVCPTQAFVAPYVLNARRCISYFTIEARSLAPYDLREGQGDWTFGCDLCQEVCPWNRRVAPTETPEFMPREGLFPLSLAALFSMSEEEFRQLFRDSPLWRAKRRGLLRNAAIVLGNQQDQSQLAPLLIGLKDAEPVVRAASAWAVGRIGTENGFRVLRQLLAQETDDTVRQELERALATV